MFLLPDSDELSWREWLRTGVGRRAIGLAAALVLEALLLLLLLTLGQSDKIKNTGGPKVAAFDVSSPPEQAPAPAEQEKPKPTSLVTPQPRQPDTPQPLPQPQPTVQPPALIPLPRAPVIPADNIGAPRRPIQPAPSNQPAYGPADTGPRGEPDSVRVGTAPDGQPLYAARWYREPYPDELRGYLSTASGPGSGTIMCRTAPEWRVEDCVAVSESPRGSNYARSVLAAAWQFKVRPPRLGGKSLVGGWVRITIYDGVRQP